LTGVVLGIKKLKRNQDITEMDLRQYLNGSYVIELWSEAGRTESRIIVKM
jgi:hypothetical protein